MDVLHALGKDPDLPDDPPEYIPIPHSALNHHESSREIGRGLRRVLEEYDGDRMMVGEVFLLDTAMVAEYYGDGDELHLAFNFPPLLAPWDAGVWRRQVDHVAELIEPVGWPSWVLSNHDQPRHRTRYGSEARARAAAVILLGLRGTPFLYAGEELGLEDAVVPPERVVDPGGRDGCRAPMPWKRAAPHGWDGAEPWLPWPPEPGAHSAEAEDADPGSMLHLYRRILAARRASPALARGDQTVLDTPDGVLAWTRRHGDDQRTVLVNFTDQAVMVGDLGGGQAIELSSVTPADEARPGPFEGTLRPDEAVILRPA
jgi:alpha-glucosidase